ncbi:MAG TPA: RagB/SusD family nutrient uptake outer membrane protein [Chryseolinea sp.]|nr:RagB/SusD family nutrient uptake outer membrane protein [Chryseolinea sp.]
MNKHIEHFHANNYNIVHTTRIKIFLWRSLLLIAAGCITMVLSSCEQFLDVSLPGSRVVSEAVFGNEDTATSAVVGMYYQMVLHDAFSSGATSSVTVMSALSSDELDDYSRETSVGEFRHNELSAANPYNLSIWRTMYKIIYMANAVIDGLEKSSGLRDEVKRQLDGEARFVRAFTYFYLVNLFGGAPLLTSTGYQDNMVSERADAIDINDQIISDLIIAKDELAAQYISGERVRPNSAAAAALLARVYLYKGEWSNAAQEATLVIDNSEYTLAPIDEVFLKNSPEAIWQLVPVFGGNTLEGNIFILTTAPGTQVPFALSDHVVESFEANDIRAVSWVGEYATEDDVFHYAHKYKIKSTADEPVEYSMVLRLAECYLIRAEARTELHDFAGAQADINSIRTRAGLLETDAADRNSLLNAVMQERKVELFTEWGHRWLDLKRTGSANTILSPIKQLWQDTDVLYPIPRDEMDKAPNLKPQNPGY